MVSSRLKCPLVDQGLNVRLTVGRVGAGAVALDYHAVFITEKLGEIPTQALSPIDFTVN